MPLLFNFKRILFKMRFHEIREITPPSGVAFVTNIFELPIPKLEFNNLSFNMFIVHLIIRLSISRLLTDSSYWRPLLCLEFMPIHTLFCLTHTCRYKQHHGVLFLSIYLFGKSVVLRRSFWSMNISNINIYQYFHCFKMVFTRGDSWRRSKVSSVFAVNDRSHIEL